jgi:hypothetical protein
MALLSAVAPPGTGANSAPSVRRRLRNVGIAGVALTVSAIGTSGVATGEAGNEQGELVDMASVRPEGNPEDTGGEDGDGQE